MVAAIGAMLRAAELKVTVMIDGFIMSACALAAVRLYPDAFEYMIFGHQGDEGGHARMLKLMGARPLLSLGLRLGEGTGALCAVQGVQGRVQPIWLCRDRAGAQPYARGEAEAAHGVGGKLQGGEQGISLQFHFRQLYDTLS